jgi:serine O-acetyltransferase
VSGISLIREDIQAVFPKDPAARSTLEVIFCYPGLHAIWLHRVAHWLWTHDLYFLGRLTQHFSRFLTGVEIHPGAKIGRRVLIDHGMGVVIGETAEVGDDCLLYAGVVLGGTTLEKVKRHPTLGKNVVVGTGSIVLGPIVLGDNSKVGAGSVVIRSVPAGSTVVGVPARMTGQPDPDQITSDLRHGDLPDPVANAINAAMDRQSRLEERLQNLESLVERMPSAGILLPEVTIAREGLDARILDALRQVTDPEAGVNVVDLGLIKDIIVVNGHVEVRVRLPVNECPYAQSMRERMERAIRGASAGREVVITLLDEHVCTVAHADCSVQA